LEDEERMEFERIVEAIERLRLMDQALSGLPIGHESVNAQRIRTVLGWAKAAHVVLSKIDATAIQTEQESRRERPV
jgi:hypothetical protein